MNSNEKSKLIQLPELYNFGYNMFLCAFNTNGDNENAYTGCRKTLLYIKECIGASEICLYKKDKYQNYRKLFNNDKNENDWLDLFIAKKKEYLEQKNIFNLDCKNITNDSHISLIPLNVNDSKYMVAIRDSKLEDLEKKPEYTEVFKETMIVILDKLEEFYRVYSESQKDRLTGLGNRDSYERFIEKLDNKDDKYSIVLFDLFRLKYLNDNYNYLLGDAYIIKTAEILKKYFPKYYTYYENGFTKKIDTGFYLYRIGGDEFVLISEYENLCDIETKIENICEEVNNLDLNIQEDLYLAVNYGMAERLNDETFKEVLLEADEKLKTHKTKMYQKLGIDRRK